MNKLITTKNADTLAIPFFFLLALYFLLKKNKTPIEYVLLLFGIGGLIADIFFAFIYEKQE
jgi:hypothetical protein